MRAGDDEKTGPRCLDRLLLDRATVLILPPTPGSARGSNPSWIDGSGLEASRGSHIRETLAIPPPSLTPPVPATRDRNQYTRSLLLLTMRHIWPGPC